MSSFIIKDVRIFDGINEIPNGYVHVESSKIKSFGPDAPPTTSSDVKVFSKPGHTLLPGFIDAHNHLHQGNVEALKQALRFGVTTIMDMHNEVDSFMKLKKVAKEDKISCADFKCAGNAATIENGWPIPVVLAHNKSPEVPYPSILPPFHSNDTNETNMKNENRC
jgi:dihydroorotase-like cyclic amidohydrolase